MNIPRELDAQGLEREAAAALEEALGLAKALRVPGARERHRERLGRAITLAGEALAATDSAGARGTLVTAHAARARDARHGAGQLSLGAQRAPTRDACDDGWERVAELVAVAEESAREAARHAASLGDDAARDAADAAAAATDARRLLDERNHATTFHASPGFSFGEGWYVAAAAVLAGVEVQLEEGAPQAAQAERFLRDAGLASRLRPYRSRPRAQKHLPELIARAFRDDSALAQRRLCAAFLGDAPIPDAVATWTDAALARAGTGPKVLLWVRDATHHPQRNTRLPELVALAARARTANLAPVVVGDAVPRGEPAPLAEDLALFWKQPPFQGEDSRRAQLQFFEHARRAHGVVGQLGVTTAGMDGPALMGLPTLYLTDAPNVRMRAWVGAVPGYEELVRDARTFERVDEVLGRWAGAAAARRVLP